MPDHRFFTTQSPIDFDQLVNVTGVGSVMPTCTPVHRVASVHHEDISDAVVFVTSADAATALSERDFCLCLSLPKYSDRLHARGGAVWVSDYPQYVFASIADALHASIEDARNDGEQTQSSVAGAHPTAVIDTSAKIGEGVRIGPNAYIGVGVEIGDGTIIGAGAVITHAMIGAGVRVLPGAALGQAGFGFAQGPNGALKRVPQLGRVLIGDYVEVGANTTIDRGALSDTIIGAETKIDNLVQIGHNVEIGRGCLIAAQVGISGSCKIDDGVLVGGQVGLADHLHIGEGAQIAARAGLMRDVPDGEKWGGTPARPVRQWLREMAALEILGRKDKKK